MDKSGGKGEPPLPLRLEFSPNFFVNELRKGVRKADGRLALRGKGRAELCKAQIVTWHQPSVKKNKKRGTQKFCPDISSGLLAALAKELLGEANENVMKYIAYCRKSTDEKDRQILSIEAQIAELSEFDKREGL